ncbi:MAG: hypothetical protein ABIQ95_06485 [Bdellovibrionia bacterium]
MTLNNGMRRKDPVTIRNYSAIFRGILNFFTLSSVLFWVQTSAVRAEGPPPADADLVTFDHADEVKGTLVFSGPSGKVPKPLKTDLSNVKYFGTLRPQEGAPYFLVSAKPCKTCQDEEAIFAVRPTDRKPAAFVYPGKILDPKSRALLFESRAFFGKCLPSRGDLYVVFQQERVDRRSKLQSSVLISEAGKDHLDETLVDRHAPRIQTALQQVKRKQCREVEGRNRLMLSRPLDLHPHSALGDDDDDDDNNKNDENNKGEKASESVEKPASVAP